MRSGFFTDVMSGSTCPNGLFSGGAVSGGSLGFGTMIHNENNQRAFEQRYVVDPDAFFAAGAESEGAEASRNRRPIPQKFVIAALVLIGISALFFNCKLPADIEKIQIANLDLSKVPDGTWIGEWNTSLVSAETAVTVLGGTITTINIMKHINGRGGPAEAVVERVLRQQSLNVDVVTGATASSKVILKSIEQALLASGKVQ